MNPLRGKTESETKKIIASLRKTIRYNEGLDSCSFIKIVRRPERDLLMFHIKAKNNCGYKSCDVDEDILIDPSNGVRVV